MPKPEPSKAQNAVSTEEANTTPQDAAKSKITITREVKVTFRGTVADAIEMGYNPAVDHIDIRNK